MTRDNPGASGHGKSGEAQLKSHYRPADPHYPFLDVEAIGR